jgi:hypothetical protein
MLAIAREQMQSFDATFVITGDVIGQRVKSAVRDLEMIAIHSGCDGWLVRPLSAQLLPPTEPETRGWINRSRLIGLQGKSRRAQLALAKDLSINPVPPPRPDCPLLAEPLANRMTQLIRSSLPLERWLLELISVGRYWQLEADACLFVGRNQQESDKLAAIAGAAATQTTAIVEPLGFIGPVALLVGNLSDANQQRAARQVARYSRNLPAQPRMLVRIGELVRELEFAVLPYDAIA